MPVLLPRCLRFEWPMLAFAFVVIAAHSFILWASCSGFPVEPSDRGVEVADTGFAC